MEPGGGGGGGGEGGGGGMGRLQDITAKKDGKSGEEAGWRMILREKVISVFPKQELKH